MKKYETPVLETVVIDNEDIVNTVSCWKKSKLTAGGGRIYRKVTEVGEESNPWPVNLFHPSALLSGSPNDSTGHWIPECRVK